MQAAPKIVVLQGLKRTLAMELVELDELQQAFREKALVDHDTAAGGLLIKVAERRATLLGLNPPLGHAVQVIQHEIECISYWREVFIADAS